MDQNPANLFVSLLWLGKGKAHFKSELARRVDIPVHLLPYQTDFLDFLKGEAVRNRAIYLATATDQKYAYAVARHLGGIFRGVVASDGQPTLKDKQSLRRSTGSATGSSSTMPGTRPLIL